MGTEWGCPPHSIDKEMRPAEGKSLGHTEGAQVSAGGDSAPSGNPAVPGDISGCPHLVVGCGQMAVSRGPGG